MNTLKMIHSYLGYRNMSPDEQTEKQINLLYDEVKEDSVYRFRYITDDLSVKNNRIIFSDYEFEVISERLSIHLENCEKIILSAATLGIKTDKKISYYQKMDMKKALIYNACANAYIEEAMENSLKELNNSFNDYKFTFPFSPGYGDLNLEVQKKILNFLETEKTIGLYLSSTNIMIPEKSITAFTGMKKKGEIYV